MTDAQKWLAALALVVAGGWLLYLLAPVLTPFLVAALLAYLGDPLVDRLEGRGMGRTLGVVVVFVGLVALFLVLILLLLPLLDTQIRTLVARVPAYFAWMENVVVPWLAAHLNLDPDMSALDTLRDSIQNHWRSAGGLAARVVDAISRSGLVLVGWAFNLVLIPVVTFYLLRDWDRLIAGIRGLLPRAWEDPVVQMTRESDEVLAGFLRGQLLVMLALGVIYAGGLWLAGLELAFLVGLVAGLVSFVPYLGFILGVVLATAAMLVQTGGDLMALVPVVGVFLVGQVIETMVLTPLLVGDRVGLHPVAVIFAVLAGGQLFGFIGVLLALPVAAVAAVFVRHAHRRYLASDIYRDRGEES
ncbi:AI-2E family transporter [Thiohalorhabdus sp.]|uniref:AI-2E family transporter n=1 Tax=Thiohalorhabdus sp. TaxID=3094134 RepID=UPI002FC358A1